MAEAHQIYCLAIFVDGATPSAHLGRSGMIAFLNSIWLGAYPNNKNTIHELLQTYVSPLHPFSKTRNNQLSYDGQEDESYIG